MINLFKKNIFLISITYTILVYVICLINVRNTVSVEVNNVDKIIHCLIYLIFTLLWFFKFYGFNFKKNSNNALLKASILAFFTGISIELLQKFLTKYRAADFNDVLANTFGVLLAVLFIYKLKKYIQLKSQK